MTPILRNVPVVNKILPASESAADESGYEGYSSLQEAVDQIKTLELQLSAATAESQTDETTIESMDPTTAEALYKEVVAKQQETTEIQDYAAAYSAMKPKEAAAIFESMTDNLQLVARILGVMSADDRGKILGVMDAAVAARVTKIMDPES